MDRKSYLQSKITIPRIFHNLLPRKNISSIIDSAPLDKAVCVTAPYGYGKTLSVVSWLRDCGLSAAWITLDASDHVESIFFAGLSAAVMRLAGWQGDANDILSDPEYAADPQDFLWVTISSAEKSAADNILVIDNFQFIHDAAFLRTVKNIIAGLLGRWRVIILSRTGFPPAFTELMLKGHICLITPKELSFSPEEMAAFFNMNGCDVPQEDIVSIRNETEGWPTSLNAVLTVSRGGPVACGKAARAYLTVFFETEIWNDLREDIRDFLLKTSVLDKLTPAACRTVTDIEDALSPLRWLYANGLFISRLDGRDAYCYHRVFRNFLQDKLGASDIDEKELYRKLARWLFANNEMDESLSCCIKAGDLYGVNQLLKTINPSDLGMERFLEITGCLLTLDIGDLKPYPVIVARMALIHFLIGNVEQMQALYRILVEWSKPGELLVSREEYSEFMWEIGWLCYMNPGEPTRDNQKHRDWCNYRCYVPHLKELHFARGAVFGFPSILRGIRDYGDDGLFDTGPFLDRIEQGDAGFLTEEESIWQTYLIHAEHLYETENFVKAEEIIRRVMVLVEDRRYTDFYFTCTALLVKLIRAAHDPKEIGALTRRLETMIVNNRNYFLLPNFHAFELRNRLAAGQAGLTETFETENRDYEDKPYFFLIYRHITLVRGLLSTGEYNRALLILDNLELLCHRYKRPTDLIEVNVLKAVAFYSLRDEDDACRYLREALALAEPYGFIRIFSDDAKAVWPVLELVRKQVTGKYIQNIVISCKKTLSRSGQKPPVKKDARTGLTKTELEILKYVQSGMSYAEIAQGNGVRMSTVKSHLHSIYSKLEVNNKTAAIIAARSKGILE